MKTKTAICFGKWLCVISIFIEMGYTFCPTSSPGDVIDKHNNINVYYNGDMSNVFGRSLTDDGYNLGLKYQCVEFVKRYYYFIYDHKMPDSYGHAIDFFDSTIQDGDFNANRGLLQFRNGSISKPQEGDIIVFNSSDSNPFGHVGIITLVLDDSLEIIQQNLGTSTRVRLPLVFHDDKFFISDKQVLAWLRLTDNEN